MEKSAPHNKIQPIGSYLAEKSSDSVIPVDRALDIQTELEKKGIYLPIGRIFVESGDIDEALLEECLLNQRREILSSVSLFVSLSPDAIAELAAASKTVVLPPGEIVCRNSDNSCIYYVIASGHVKVFRQGNGKTEVQLATLGPGDGFGEIALLTDWPRSASVETVERTGLILIPGDAFEKAVFSHPEAAKACAKTLAERLAKGNVLIMEASSAGRAYRQFISQHFRRKEQMLIGNSPAVMMLLQEIEDIAGNNKPVLVRGEPGTEMLEVAELVHELKGETEGILMDMDAKAANGTNAHGPEIDDPRYEELLQSSILFGRTDNTLTFAPEKRLGLLTLTRGGVVVIQNVEHLAAGVQGQLADYLETGMFCAMGENTMLPSNARIVATSSTDLAALTEERRV